MIGDQWLAERLGDGHPVPPLTGVGEAGQGRAGWGKGPLAVGCPALLLNPTSSLTAVGVIMMGCYSQ